MLKHRPQTDNIMHHHIPPEACARPPRRASCRQTDNTSHDPQPTTSLRGFRQASRPPLSDDITERPQTAPALGMGSQPAQPRRTRRSARPPARASRSPPRNREYKLLEDSNGLHCVYPSLLLPKLGWLALRISFGRLDTAAAVLSSDPLVLVAKCQNASKGVRESPSLSVSLMYCHLATYIHASHQHTQTTRLLINHGWQVQSEGARRA